MLFITPKYKLWFTYPQLGLLYLASTARDAGEHVELLDANTMSQKSFFSRLDKMAREHEFIGVTVNISQVESAYAILEFLRRNHPSRKIIIGGPFATTAKEEFLGEYADIAVLGEGERQLRDILSGKKTKEIPGIAYSENARVVTTKPAVFIENLDSIPFPAYDLVDFRKYRHPGKKPLALIISSRGCPYRCINCTKFMHGNAYRTRSIDNLMAEMGELIEKYSVKEIHFWDDNLTLIPERVKNICREIIRRGYHRKTRFAIPAGIRADIVDEEMFKLMKEANFYIMGVAVESGDQAVIDRIGKELNLEKVPATLRILENLGFRIMLYFMIGFPFESSSSMRKTIDLASSLPGHHVHFFKVTPLPGTELFNLCDGAGAVHDFRSRVVSYDMPDSISAGNECGVDNRQIKKYIRKGYIKFYMNPMRVLQTVAAMVRDGGIVHDTGFIIRQIARILFRGHR